MTELPIKNKSFDESGAQYAWDATSLTLAQTCLRKYYYKMIEGWQPRGLSVHLRFGQHYATALEHFYKHRALGLDKDAALHLVIREALEATWDYPVCPECQGAGEVEEIACTACDGTGREQSGIPWTSGHPAKTRENLIRTIIWYIDQFDDESIKVLTLANGLPAVEYSFSLPVDNNIIFSGHIDRLVTYGDDIMVMDQKTSGSAITPHFFSQFKPNTQMSLYTFAGKMIYNLPVKGVIIDGAQIAVGFSAFGRGFTFRTPSELNEWYDDSLYWVDQARTATLNRNFPMNPASCGNYGGCEFRNVCSKSPEIRGQFLKGDFEQLPTWDPLKAR